jgi:flagellar secretion chaperone FliS
MTNHYQQSLSVYANQQIETASPEQLLLMLYDGAIRFMNEATKALAENDLESFNTKLIKTQNILSELMSSLDMKVGGELAGNLFRLYEYLHYRLVQANIKKDQVMLDEVLGHMKDLRVTWDQAIRQSKSTDTIQPDSSGPAEQMPESDSSVRDALNNNGALTTARSYSV